MRDQQRISIFCPLLFYKLLLPKETGTVFWRAPLLEKIRMPPSRSQLRFCLPGWSPSQLASRHTFSSAVADVRVSTIRVKQLGFSSSYYSILSRKAIFFPCTSALVTWENSCPCQRPGLCIHSTLLLSLAPLFFLERLGIFFPHTPLHA